MAVFWVVAPCSLIEVYQRFRGPTRRYNPEDSHLRTHRRENLKSYLNRHSFILNIMKLIRVSIQWHQIYSILPTYIEPLSGTCGIFSAYTFPTPEISFQTWKTLSWTADWIVNVLCLTWRKNNFTHSRVCLVMLSTQRYSSHFEIFH
jgi:hypothetical protein